MASAKLYLDKRTPRKDGTFPLKISITHKESFMINLKIYLFEEQLIENNESLTKHEVVEHKNKKFLNNIIQQRFVDIKKLLLKLEADGKLRGMTAKQLKSQIEKLNSIEDEDENEEKPYLFKEHTDKLITDKNNKGTKKMYRYTLNKISEFTDIETLTFEEIDVIWLKNFEKFMSKTCEMNSRAIHFRNIRAIFNDAIDEDKVPLNIYPFRKFKIRKEATMKRSMTVDELVMLRDFKCEEYLEKYRDLFMLIFYLIGINIVDLLHLTEIRNNKIEYKRAKTKKLYTIRVEPEAKAIIKKYKGTNYLLDVLDVYADYQDFNRRMNRNLKKIGHYSIGKHGKKTIESLFPDISTYYARHTWATIAASLDIPKETIAAALGHGGNTVTDIYINFDQKKIDAANRKVIDYLHSTKKKHLMIADIVRSIKLNKTKEPSK